jgi:hypothetical protein
VWREDSAVHFNSIACCEENNARWICGDRFEAQTMWQLQAAILQNIEQYRGVVVAEGADPG